MKYSWVVICSLVLFVELSSSSRVWPTPSRCAPYFKEPAVNLTYTPFNITRDGTSSVYPVAVDGQRGVVWVATEGQLVSFSLADNSVIRNTSLNTGHFESISIDDSGAAYSVWNTGYSSDGGVSAVLYRIYPDTNEGVSKFALPLPPTATSIVHSDVLVSEDKPILYVVVRYCKLESCDDGGRSAMLWTFSTEMSLELLWSYPIEGYNLTNGLTFTESSLGLAMFMGGDFLFLDSTGSVIWKEASIADATSSLSIAFTGANRDLIAITAGNPKYFIAFIDAKSGKVVNKVITGLSMNGLSALLVDSAGSVYVSSGYVLFKFTEGGQDFAASRFSSFPIALTCDESGFNEYIVSGSRGPSALLDTKSGDLVKSLNVYSKWGECGGGASLGNVAEVSLCFGGPSGGQLVEVAYSAMH